MDKCKPVQMRKNLEMVNAFKGMGIDFMPIPVRDEAHRIQLAQLGAEILEEMAAEAEKDMAK